MRWIGKHPSSLTQEALTDLNAAGFDSSRETDSIARALEKTHGGDADLGLVEFGEQIIEQQHVTPRAARCARLRGC